MLRACFVLVGGFLTGAFILAALMATGASAGMSRDLSDCTAAKDRGAVSACTRVMTSGRLPNAQMYIGYFNRGTAWRRVGEPAKAIADYTKVLELKPGFARAYEARGFAKSDLGTHAEAVSDLDEAVSQGKGDWRFLYSRAVVLRSEGDRAAALRDLQSAGDLKPDAAQIALMRALVRADAGEIDAAREEIARVVETKREEASAYYARAWVSFSAGDTAAAEANNDRALSLRSGFASALMLKARILEARGDRKAARSSYDKALAVGGDGFDGLAARRIARQRLAALGGDAAPKRGSDVAEAKIDPPRPLDCKVFLPATGSVVTSKCSE